jgi:hypothetical protein
MTIDRRLTAGALSLSLVLAACGGAAASPAATTGGDATAAPTSEPAATPAPTQPPEATEAPTEAATDDGGANPLNDLASKLPETVGDITFERTGFDGDQLGIYGAAAGLSGDQLEPILKANGKTLNDVNFAIAASQGTDVGALVYAVQIEGVRAEDIMAAMSVDTAGMTEDTVGGKKVYTAGVSGFGEWVYPKDDVVYLILLASDDIAKGILQQLP